MAEKRMLTRKITENDNFVKLPATAQALYLHLTLSADDDGFCNQIETAMFRAHAKPKDLQALIDKRYLLQFDSGVICIKHWRMANSLRKDRYEATAYQDEYRRLTVKKNGAYTLTDKWQPSGNQTATEEQPTDAARLPQSRVEKSRVEESRVEKGESVCDARTRTREEEPPRDRWEEFWNAYPRKSGGDIRTACMEYLKVIDSGQDPEALIQAARDLAARTEPQNFRYLPAAEKWLRNKGWLEKPEETGKQTSNPFLRKMLRETEAPA